MTDEIAPAEPRSIGSFEAGAHSAKMSARVAKRAAKEAKLQAKLAKQRAKLMSTEAKLRVAEVRSAKAGEDAALSQRGFRRQFLTGRVVPVRQSRRAKAHSRRLFGGKE